MENGAERVDVVQLRDREHIVNEDKVQESVGVAPEVELEDEVFEEVMPGAEPVDSVVEVAGVDEDAGAVHDEETFEEASDVPDEMRGTVVDKDKAVVLVAAESIDKIDEGGTNQEVEAVKIDEGNSVLEVDDDLDREGTSQEVEATELGKEVVDGDGSAEVLKGGDDVVTSRDFEFAGDAFIRDAVTEEVEGDMKGGIGSQETRGLADVPLDLKAVKDEVTGESLVQDAGTKEVEGGVKGEIVSKETRGLAVVLLALEEVNDKSTLETKELADELLGLEKEKCEDKNMKVAVNGEREYEENGETKGEPVVLESQNGVYYSNLGDGPRSDDQHQDPRTDDSKDVPDLENSNHHEEAPKTEVSTGDPDEPVVLKQAAQNLTSVPLSDKCLTDNSQAHAANLKFEDKTAHQLSKPAGIVRISEKIDLIVDKLAQEAKEPPDEKQNVPASGQSDIQSGPRLASPPSKPVSSAPPARPAGLGSAAPLLEPVPRATQPSRVNGTVSHLLSQQIEDSTNGEAEVYDETREKLQMIRVKFLRLARRLGQTPHNVVVAQVLYRLGLAEQLRGRNGGRVGAFSFDRASAMAEQLEAAGQEALDFSCTIMVIGKSGVGKSATINSIFDEVKSSTDAFKTSTKKVQDVVGTVQGIKVRVIDTPGLLPSWSDQRQNEKILQSVKRFINKTPPDIVLYLDRLDMQSRDFSDMPLLRTITEIFGPSIWFNAIVVLTHAASDPPDGPNGTASSYDMFVTQRSHVAQQAIRQAAGDMRLMNPISLVENHSACRTNRAGQRVLPNGLVWKPHLVLLSFASKILAEANALLKLQDSPPGAPFAPRSRAPPLPFLLSSLLQSRPQLKLPDEQFDEDGLDDDLVESSDSEDEPEFRKLPTFKSLTKSQVEKLTRAQKNAYFDELEYREKLLMKKQLKEERRRRRAMKKSAAAAAAKGISPERRENVEEEESGGAASVPVLVPDLALPASFDSDNPTHRYRYLDGNNQWLVRPVLETHGWDHDVGYEGINVERMFAVKDKVPVSFSGQVTKDKKDASVQMEVASSIKHGEGKMTSLGLDMQTVGKDLAYTLRSETMFINYRKNKATAGISLTHLGDAISAGFKVEDKLIANKRFQMVISGGAMTGRGDVAYGGSLEAQLRDKDYPLGRSLSTLGLSVMDWHGDLAVGCNLQSQVPIGRSTNLIARANLNNRGSGQVSFRVNSSEQLQIALVALVPLLKKLIAYPCQIQFGQ